MTLQSILSRAAPGTSPALIARLPRVTKVVSAALARGGRVMSTSAWYILSRKAGHFVVAC
jgi:hypothetical protein